jgi:peroxiredoxin
VHFKHLTKISLLLLMASGLVAGCGSDDKTSAAAGDAQADIAAATAVGGTKGDRAPDFTLKRLAGGNLTLSDLRGKTVVVDFWDTWCPPCRRALPDLQALSETYRDDLVVVGVAFGREGEAKVRSYIEANGLTFEMVLFEPNSSIIEDFGGIQSIPTTFLVDANGVIQEKWVGAADKATYERAIVTAIKRTSETS